MKARLISCEDEEAGLAVIAIGEVELSAMDCLGYGQSEQSYPKVGEEFIPEFSCQFNDEATWEEVFGGNASKEAKLEQVGRWSYKAYGKVVAIVTAECEALVDCGICKVPAPIHISDPACLGAYIAFEIQRLDVWRA